VPEHRASAPMNGLNLCQRKFSFSENSIRLQKECPSNFFCYWHGDRIPPAKHSVRSEL